MGHPDDERYYRPQKTGEEVQVDAEVGERRPGSLFRGSDAYHARIEGCEFSTVFSVQPVVWVLGHLVPPRFDIPLYVSTGDGFLSFSSTLSAVLTKDDVCEKEKAVNRPPDRYACAHHWNYRGGKRMKFKPLWACALAKEIQREQRDHRVRDRAPRHSQGEASNCWGCSGGRPRDVKEGVGDVVVRKYSGTEIKLDD
jgi:hypothetical protein